MIDAAGRDSRASGRDPGHRNADEVERLQPTRFFENVLLDLPVTDNKGWRSSGAQMNAQICEGLKVAPAQLAARAQVD